MLSLLRAKHHQVIWHIWANVWPGPCSKYRNSHYKDKKCMRTSCLYNMNSYVWQLVYIEVPPMSIPHAYSKTSTSHTQLYLDIFSSPLNSYKNQHSAHHSSMAWPTVALLSPICMIPTHQCHHNMVFHWWPHSADPVLNTNYHSKNSANSHMISFTLIHWGADIMRLSITQSM